MSFPKEITILGVTYRVVEATGMVDTERDCLGETFHHRKLIEIEKSLSDEEKERVLLHELGHVIMDRTGLSELFTAKQEEAICTILEHLAPVYKRRE